MKHIYCKQLSDYATGYVEHKDHEPELAEKYAKWFNTAWQKWIEANDNGVGV
jgi:hypothetical protein